MDTDVDVDVDVGSSFDVVFLLELQHTPQRTEMIKFILHVGCRCCGVSLMCFHCILQDCPFSMQRELKPGRQSK